MRKCAKNFKEGDIIRCISKVGMTPVVGSTYKVTERGDTLYATCIQNHNEEFGLCGGVMVDWTSHFELVTKAFSPTEAYSIRILSADHSKLIQEFLFSKGFTWESGDSEVFNTNAKFLNLNGFSKHAITCGDVKAYDLITTEELFEMLENYSPDPIWLGFNLKFEGEVVKIGCKTLIIDDVLDFIDMCKELDSEWIKVEDYPKHINIKDLYELECVINIHRC